MDNPLVNLANQSTLIVINPQTLLDYLHQDRECTYQQGFYDGSRAIRMLSKKEASRFLDVSEQTIDNLRKRGELQSAEYCGQVHFEIQELQNYVEKHKGLYYTIKSRITKN